MFIQRIMPNATPNGEATNTKLLKLYIWNLTYFTFKYPVRTAQ